MRCLLVTDIPAPWRERVYEIVHERLGDDFHVAYCHVNEKRRLWRFQHGSHPKTFLRNLTVTIRGRERYFNVGIVPFLLRSRPRIVVCFSLNPTIFVTYVVARLMGAKVIVFADTWLGRDGKLGWMQVLGRRIAYRWAADAFLGASQKTLEMFRHYRPGIPQEALHQSALCADNDAFWNAGCDATEARSYDIMYSGRISAEKNPKFLAEVASELRSLRGHCRLLVIGDGETELKQEMFEALERGGVDYTFAGFIEHARLPEFYRQAKVLLLPTSGDCWGVVINEAMASGTPVVTTNMTAAAGELVLHGQNGWVLPLDARVWGTRINELLSDDLMLKRFRESGLLSVSRYSFERAAAGILSAIRYVERGKVAPAIEVKDEPARRMIGQPTSGSRSQGEG